MSNRRFEMFQLRNILVRMRQGESDRSLDRLHLIGRDKARQVRRVFSSKGWLDPDHPLPSETEIAAAMAPSDGAGTGSSCSPPTSSSVEPFRQQVTEWVHQGVESKTIHQALVRNHQYTGSYSSVHRFVRQLSPPTIKPTAHLDFKPGEAAQIDFGTGPSSSIPVPIKRSNPGSSSSPWRSLGISTPNWSSTRKSIPGYCVIAMPSSSSAAFPIGSSLITPSAPSPKPAITTRWYNGPTPNMPKAMASVLRRYPQENPRRKAG